MGTGSVSFSVAAYGTNLLFSLEGEDGDLAARAEKIIKQLEDSGALDKEKTTQVIDAQKLSATVTDGKTYWRIKGGEYMKYGVPIYEEVIAAAGRNVEDLNSAKTYTLTGTATILMEGGKPKKVIELNLDGE